jgi:hypothetical protein
MSFLLNYFFMSFLLNYFFMSFLLNYFLCHFCYSFFDKEYIVHSVFHFSLISERERIK